MSKKIFINNLNTFVSKALLEELKESQKGEEGEENPDAAIIFGTYIDKDSSERPSTVKKMLKVSIDLICNLFSFQLYRDPNQDWQ